MSDYKPRLVKRGDGNYRDVMRPLRFGELIGPAVRIADPFITMLSNTGKIDNHAIMFCGDSGSGKTTLAFLLGLALNCVNPQPNRVSGAKVEPCLECANCKIALSNGMRNTSMRSIMLWNSSTVDKNQMADIVDNYIMGPRGISGSKVVVNIFDEAHKLTKEQQSVLLTPLEALPKYSYVFLTTNEPEKFKSQTPIMSRFTTLNIPAWKDEDIQRLLTDVSFIQHTQSGRAVPYSEALDYIVKLADGNSRTALSVLQHVLEGTSESDSGYIDVETVRQMFPTPEDLLAIATEGVDLRGLFKAFYSRNVVDAVIELSRLEEQRVPAVDIAFSLNKYLKNQTIKAANDKNSARILEVVNMLDKFGAAFSSDGEAYARLLTGVTRALAK